MSIDVPDYQRAAVKAQQVLGEFPLGTAVGTVFVPPNVEGIWVILGPSPDPTPSVVGTSSGVSYPTYGPIALAGLADGGYSFFCPMASAVDSEVRVTWASAPNAEWWVLGDTGGRFVIDAALAQAMASAGANAPTAIVQVGGNDGTELHALLTDSSGRLEVTGSTFPPVYAPINTAMPADALAVGGSDGTDLRPLLTDGSGRALTIDQTIKLCVAALNATLPADALLMGGSDGTDLRALLTDNSGHALTIDQTLKLCVAVLNAALPADALLVGGSDGTDLRALLTDSAGHPLTIDQTLKLCVAALAATTPADAVLVAGSDGTHLRALATDTTGVLTVSDEILIAASSVAGAAVPARAVAGGVSDGTDLRIALGDKRGLAYVLPSLPDTASGDHPPVEYSLASLNTNIDNNAIIAAPGAGKRIRVFYVQVQSAFTSSSNASCNVVDAASGVSLAASSSTTGFFESGTLDARPTGVPLTTNAALNITNHTLGSYYNVTVLYTIETV